MVDNEIKKKYNKPELITHDTVKNLTEAVSVGSADLNDGLY
ncbi:hypothetical protein [Methanobacterium sp. BAmetb5]|nr:hypothetical protein [Methanobacterium sp. BAmetb5]